MSGVTLTLYTRPGCILCAQVQKQLDDAGMKYAVVEVRNGDPVIRRLELAGVASYPALFLDDRYIGGFSHVVHLLTQGRLHAIVARAW